MILAFPFVTASLDSDAKAFLNTTGATDRAAINFFVKGIKRLGLWDDMVCWPLRSAQNAGTGSTAYSLGGLGAYNGTLVNGPTWGADGVDFTAASSQSISTSAVLQVGASGGVYNTTSGGDRGIFSSRPPTGDWVHGTTLWARENNDSFALVDVGGTGPSRIRATGTPIFGEYVFTQATHTLAGSSVAANTTYRQNKNSRSSGLYVVGTNEAMGTSISAIRIGAGNSGAGFGFFDGPMAFVYVSESIFSSQTQESLFDLYKSTLGQGLGLP
jgi:hypothetical protein